MKSRRQYALGLCLLFIGFLCIAFGTPSRGQYMLMTGAGKAPTVSASFSGSGDVVSGALVYWSCARAYTAAYASGGGNACDIIRASDSKTCTTKFNSTGFLDVTTAYCNGSTQSVTAFCNATTCNITKAYDQSGAINCIVACDATEATGANQPVLNLSGLNGRVCMTFSGAQDLTSPGIAPPVPQPFSGSFVSERTGNTSNFSGIVGVGTAQVQFLYNAAANQAGPFAGNVGAAQAVAATDNSYHALSMIVNDPSSIVVVDGAATGSLSAGANGIASTNVFTLGNNNNPLTGVICEARIDAIAYNATQYGNLNSNQHSASGYGSF